MESSDVLFWSAAAASVCVAISVVVNRREWLLKMRMLSTSYQFMTKSRDNKWKTPPDPASQREFVSSEPVQKKRVVIVRHGESQWNEVFNKSLNPIFFIPRLMRAFLREFSYLFFGDRDSLFYDSPLNSDGHAQAEELRKFLADPSRVPGDGDEYAAVNAMLGEGSTVTVSSPLRRCLSTAAIGFHHCLSVKKQPIVILPCLQEISKNVDTMAMCLAHESPPCPVDERFMTEYDIAGVYERADVSRYDGNKSLDANGLTRMQAFTRWAFDTNKADTIVISGHSLWTLYFFRTYLDYGVDHVAKGHKLGNGAAVVFNLCRQGSVCWIELESIKPVFKGFDQKKVSKKYKNQ